MERPLVVSRVASLFRLRPVRSIHSRSRKAGFMTRSVGARSGQLSIPSVCCLLPTPKWAACRAKGVIVRWPRAETLLFPMMANKENLHACSDSEEEATTD